MNVSDTLVLSVWASLLLRHCCETVCPITITGLPIDNEGLRQGGQERALPCALTIRVLHSMKV